MKKAILFLALACFFGQGRAEDMSFPIQSREIISPVYAIDRIYKSMQGPQSTREVTLGHKIETPELLWITGYRAHMVGPDGRTPQSQEFMCHRRGCAW